MALAVAQGVLQINTLTANATFTVSGLAFQPKALICWTTGRASTVGSIGTGHHDRAIGFATDPLNRRCIGSHSDNAATSAQADQTMRNDCILGFFQHSATQTAGGRLDVNAINVDGFQLILDAALDHEVEVHWLALGGSDLTNVGIAELVEPSAAGDVSDTTLGFQPDAAFFLSAGRGALSNTQIDSAGSFGFASSPTNQFVWAGASNDGSNTMVTRHYSQWGEVLAMWSTAVTSVDNRASLTSFDPTGLTLTFASGTTTGRRVAVLALKGGQYAVGNVLTRADSSAIPTPVGFQPHGALFLSAQDADTAAGTVANDDAFSLGVASTDGATITRSVAAYRDRTGIGTSAITTSIQYDCVYCHCSTSATQDGGLDVTSFDSDGFTTMMSPPELSVSGRTVAFLAFGDAAVSAPPQAITPAAASALWSAHTPTVTASATTAPLAATSAWVSNGLAIVTSAGIAPLPAPSLWTALAPALASGGPPQTESLGATSATWSVSALAPQVEGIVMAPAPASAIWGARAPGVVVAGVRVTPAPAASTWAATALTMAAGGAPQTMAVSAAAGTSIALPFARLTGGTTLSLLAAKSQWSASGVVFSVSGGAQTMDLGLASGPAIAVWNASPLTMAPGGVIRSLLPASAAWGMSSLSNVAGTVVVTPVAARAAWQALDAALGVSGAPRTVGVSAASALWVAQPLGIAPVATTRPGAALATWTALAPAFGLGAAPQHVTSAPAISQWTVPALGVLPGGNVMAPAPATAQWMPSLLATTAGGTTQALGASSAHWSALSAAFAVGAPPQILPLAGAGATWNTSPLGLAPGAVTVTPLTSGATWEVLDLTLVSRGALQLQSLGLVAVSPRIAIQDVSSRIQITPVSPQVRIQLMTPPVLSPGNPFVLRVSPRVMDVVTGRRTVLPEGTMVRGYFVTDVDATEPADPKLGTTGTVDAAGSCFLSVDGTLLTAALCDPLFLQTAPIFIVESVGHFRVAVKARYLHPTYINTI